MIHDELVYLFTIGDFKENTLVRIELNDGKTGEFRLLSGKVGAETNGEGEKMNSRIGLKPPPAPTGKSYGNQIITIYTKDIKSITKV